MSNNRRKNKILIPKNVVAMIVGIHQVCMGALDMFRTSDRSLVAREGVIRKSITMMPSSLTMNPALVAPLGCIKA